jgi:sulfate transport system permease protein
MKRRGRYDRVLPGFGLSIGFAVTYFTCLVLIPLSMLVLKSASMGPSTFWNTVSSDRALAAFRLSLESSLLAALVNGVFGFIVAWVLVRYPFPGRRFVDGLVDLPLALPTAVAGIALTTLFARDGWIGRWLDPLGVQVAYAPLGIVIALTFVGLPFVVRTVQPVLAEVEATDEEAAASLGARRFDVFRRVIFPEVRPALLTGMTLAFARALGEYGSIVFISGNLPMKTEITPLLIMIKLEQFDYAGATALALVFLILSFGLLGVIHFVLARTGALGRRA